MTKEAKAQQRQEYHKQHDKEKYGHGGSRAIRKKEESALGSKGSGFLRRDKSK